MDARQAPAQSAQLHRMRQAPPRIEDATKGQCQAPQRPEPLRSGAGLMLCAGRAASRIWRKHRFAGRASRRLARIGSADAQEGGAAVDLLPDLEPVCLCLVMHGAEANAGRPGTSRFACALKVQQDETGISSQNLCDLIAPTRTGEAVSPSSPYQTVRSRVVPSRDGLIPGTREA